MYTELPYSSVILLQTPSKSKGWKKAFHVPACHRAYYNNVPRIKSHPFQSVGLMTMSRFFVGTYKFGHLRSHGQPPSQHIKQTPVFCWGIFLFVAPTPMFVTCCWFFINSQWIHGNQPCQPAQPPPWRAWIILVSTVWAIQIARMVRKHRRWHGFRMVGLFVRVCEMFVLFGALWTLSVVRLYEELVLFFNFYTCRSKLFMFWYNNTFIFVYHTRIFVYIYFTESQRCQTAGDIYVYIKPSQEVYQPINNLHILHHHRLALLASLEPRGESQRFFQCFSRAAQRFTERTLLSAGGTARTTAFSGSLTGKSSGRTLEPRFFWGIVGGTVGVCDVILWIGGGQNLWFTVGKSMKGTPIKLHHLLTGSLSVWQDPIYRYFMGNLYNLFACSWMQITLVFPLDILDINI